MLWFFEKRDAWLHYEIRRQADGDAYELVITYAGGRQEVERYAKPSDVVERSMHLQQELTKAGWHAPDTTARTVGRGSRSDRALPLQPGMDFD
jgi:hypothetical protein